MKHDASNQNDELDPSIVTKELWIFAFRQIENAPKEKSNGNGGKWLIFGSVEKTDENWKAIKLATEQGLLGKMSKAATEKYNPKAKNHSFERVICVNTYEANDKENIMKIRQELRNLGFIKKLPYKTDEMTRNGIYSSDTDEKISLYYE